MVNADIGRQFYVDDISFLFKTLWRVSNEAKDIM